jgi:hypothetical protein
MQDATSHDSQADWPRQAADLVERYVTAARDKTTLPAIKVARALVYGTVATFCAIAIAVLGAIALVRIVDNLVIPGDGNVWIAHLVVGLLFVIGGAICWRLRTPRES